VALKTVDFLGSEAFMIIGEIVIGWFQEFALSRGTVFIRMEMSVGSHEAVGLVGRQPNC
jgi:hypothetical protein